MRLILAAAVLASLCLHVGAQEVSEKEGNIYLLQNGKTRQLTDRGLDSSPNLSPDGKLIVFIRATHGKKIATGSGEAEATQLWSIGLDGKNATKLLEGVANSEAKELLAGLATPQFSPDGGKVYFQSEAFATSGAIHVLDLKTRKQKFVCAGNSLEVIRSGEYAGHLIVQQHRYFLGGGSYDWYWLLRPDGTDVGAIGEDAADFKDLYVTK